MTLPLVRFPLRALPLLVGLLLLPALDVIGQQTPVIDLTPRSGPAGQQNGPFTLSIGGGSSPRTPQGNVTLQFDNRLVGTYTLGSSGYLNLTFPPLEAGRYGLRVTYSGDAFFQPVDTLLPLVIFPAEGRSIDARGVDDGVSVSWHAPGLLVVSRIQAGQPWSAGSEMCCGSTPWLDALPLPETVYLYRMESPDGMSFSNVDVAMRFAFTDDNLPPDRRVSLPQVAEVVRAANLLRGAAGLDPVTLPPVTVTPGKRRSSGSSSGVPSSHVVLLRTAINEARVSLGAYAFPFTVPVTAEVALNAAHLQELREAVR
ncbi:MAG TPA: Ig-like domain-containing protein [Thermoanaerobaculia bacterium]